MVTNASEFLTNPCEFLTKLTISMANFGLINANVKTTYECPTITTNALPSIRIYCDAYENNKNMLSYRILGTGS